MRKIWLNGLVVCFMVFATACFSACTFTFDGSGIVPEIIIETDNKLKLEDDKYVLTLVAGERYVIDANLGDYGENEYYIEFEIKTETDLIELNGSEIVVADNVTENGTVTIVVLLKKQSETKVISSEEINVTIVAGGSLN